MTINRDVSQAPRSGCFLEIAPCPPHWTEPVYVSAKWSYAMDCWIAAWGGNSIVHNSITGWIPWPTAEKQSEAA